MSMIASYGEQPTVNSLLSLEMQSTSLQAMKPTVCGSPVKMTDWHSMSLYEDLFKSDIVDYKYALVILNQPIMIEPQIMFKIWRKARITVTVDGGTDMWNKFLEDHGKNIYGDPAHVQKFVPNLITGDMDSCSNCVVYRFADLGSTIVRTIDQNETDYFKALKQLMLYAHQSDIKLDTIYVVVETSGRIDHILANINTLYKSEGLVGNVKVMQLSNETQAWLLTPGTHVIHIPNYLMSFTNRWCGLIPVGYPVNCISTSGLRWNLKEASLKFGGLVSTSNEYTCEKVTVITDTSVLWAMRINYDNYLPSKLNKSD